MNNYSFANLIKDIESRMNLPFRKMKFLFSDSGCISYMCLRNWEMGISEPQELLKELLLDRLEGFEEIGDLVRSYRAMNGYNIY